jgi:hypothetical protein
MDHKPENKIAEFKRKNAFIMMRKSFFLLGFLFLSLLLKAQGNGKVEMADTMRSNGKIYVVVAVILTIFAGIILYLVRLDRKVSKLEKETRSHQFTTK